MVIYLDEQETRNVGEVAATLASIVTPLIPEATLVSLITAAGFMMKLKARRCLKHGKCMAITVAGGLAIPREYTPGVDDKPPPVQGLWS